MNTLAKRVVSALALSLLALAVTGCAEHHYYDDRYTEVRTVREVRPRYERITYREYYRDDDRRPHYRRYERCD